MKNRLAFLLINTFLLITSLVYSQGLDVEYKDDQVNLKGYFSKGNTGLKNAPGIVIIHQWMGLSQHEKDVANKLAALGYNAFAADIYGVGNIPKSMPEAGKQAGKYKSDYKTYQSRIQAAIDQLIALGADSNKIVVIGYCFGGTGALEAARGELNVKGVVSFHGGLGKDTTRMDQKLNTKILVLHGADDPFVSKMEVDRFQKEMKNSQADWQMIYYANSVHAFTHKDAGSDNSKGVAYNQKADERSWQHLLIFLKEVIN
jgi:dienelactone hydrolase